MSGRGNSRYSGRGRGRGSAKKKNKESKDGTPKERKSLSDYKYFMGSTKSAPEYDIITEYLLHHIGKSINPDVSKALEELKEFEFASVMPTLERVTPVAGDTAATAILELSAKTIFDKEVDDFIKRKGRYRDDMQKAYHFLWDQCNSAIQSKIRGRVDFESTVKDDPIELLKVIKIYCYNYDEQAKHNLDILHQSLKNFCNIKQKEDESVLEYKTRFSSVRSIAVSIHGSALGMDAYIKKYGDYNSSDPVKVKELRKKAFEELSAIIFLNGADRLKYAEFLDGIKTQYTLGHDQYPKTLDSAVQTLNAQKIDKAYYENKKKREKARSQQASNDNATDNTPVESLTFAQFEGRCWCCGKKGHLSNKCPDRNKPQNEWAMSKTPQVAQMMNAVTTTTNDPASRAMVVFGRPQFTMWMIPNTIPAASFNNAYHQLYSHAQESSGFMSQLRSWILLDNESSVDLYCNPEYVNNIRDVSQHAQVGTNGGGIRATQRADVPNYGWVWYNKQAITNILSFGNVVDRGFKVDYNQKEDYFFIQYPDCAVIEFRRSPDTYNLYVWKPPKIAGVANVSTTGVHTKPPEPITGVPTAPPKKKVQFAQTVEENKSFHTDREIARAKRARDLIHATGNPPVDLLKQALRQNLIADCPVTSNDLTLATKIFGPDVASIKGRSTRKRPHLQTDDTIDVPPELYDAQRGVDLCVDVLFVNGIPFMSSVSKRIFYRAVQHLPNKYTTSHLEKAIRRVTKPYRDADLQVVTISADREFKPALDNLSEELGYNPDLRNAGEHEPTAERNNRTLKDRYRIGYHSSPIRVWPRMLVIGFVAFTTPKLNIFPPKHGISPYFSPHAIIHQEAISYKTHCRIPLLSAVIASNEPQPLNSMAPRGLECIYLGFLDGTHHCYHIATGQLITRANVTPVPLTPAMIKAVEDHALAEGMPAGLKITTSTGVILYDSASTAGVDYDGDYYTDDDDEDYSDSDSSDDDESDHSSDDDEYRPDDGPEEDPVDAEYPDQDPIDEDPEEEQADPDLHQSTVDEEQDDASVEDAQEQPQVTATGRPARNAPREPFNVSDVKGQSYASVADPGTHEYSEKEARVVATIMTHIAENIDKKTVDCGGQFVVTYSLQKGLKKFGDRAKQGTLKEVGQLHDRNCWEPIHKSQLNDTERKRTMRSLFFLTEKRDGTIKGRQCADGSTQREYMSRENTSSPTVSTESLMLTAVIEALEGRDVFTCDVPNAFIQTEVSREDEEGNKTIMKVRGALVDILCEIDEKYKEYVVYEGGHKVLYLHIIRALYGMLISSLLYYRKFVSDISTLGFELNPYDPCVANRMVNGKQQTIAWHVDDVKGSHVDSKVNDKLIKWIEDTYGKIGKVKVVRGKIHDYLGMTLDYSVPGQVTIDMVDYITSMIEAFPEEHLKGSGATTPWTEKLFKLDEDSPPLSKELAELFHKVTAQGLFACKRARPDISPAIAYFTTRVRAPNEDDFSKLVRMMKFLSATKGDKLTLRANDSNDDTLNLKWYIDAAFGVHHDFKSHTGSVMTMGEGAVTSNSLIQKLNTRSSTEAEIVGVDDMMGPVVWSKHFLEAQGHKVNNVVMQDNESSIKLESNGRKSAGKRSRHLNIRLFFVTDQKDKRNIDIQYCPTDLMWGDYMSKPLVGAKFKGFRQKIMNLPAAAQLLTAAFIEKGSEK